MSKRIIKAIKIGNKIDFYLDNNFTQGYDLGGASLTDDIITPKQKIQAAVDTWIPTNQGAINTINNKLGEFRTYILETILNDNKNIENDKNKNGHIKIITYERDVSNIKKTISIPFELLFTAVNNFRITRGWDWEWWKPRFPSILIKPLKMLVVFCDGYNHYPAAKLGTIVENNKPDQNNPAPIVPFTLTFTGALLAESDALIDTLGPWVKNKQLELVMLVGSTEGQIYKAKLTLNKKTDGLDWVAVPLADNPTDLTTTLIAEIEGYQILHYFGHGITDDTGVQQLALQPGVPFSPGNFNPKNCKMLRLVILHACNSEHGNVAGLLVDGGFGKQLLENNVTDLLCDQMNISTGTATIFTKKIYQALTNSDGLKTQTRLERSLSCLWSWLWPWYLTQSAIADAVLFARQASELTRGDWLSPVHYSRESVGGVIFVRFGWVLNVMLTAILFGIAFWFIGFQSITPCCIPTPPSTSTITHPSTATITSTITPLPTCLPGQCSSGTPTPEDMPFIVADHFVDSGYMGDIGDVAISTSIDDVTGAKIYHIAYKKAGINPQCNNKPGVPCKFAGVYWLYPDKNWGTLPGAGFNLSKAHNLSFKVKGYPGVTIQILAGAEKQDPQGTPFPYPNSFRKIPKLIKLKEEWLPYTIPLQGNDLSFVIAGLGWVVPWGNFPDGVDTITFDLKDIQFEQ